MTPQTTLQPNQDQECRTCSQCHTDDPAPQYLTHGGKNFCVSCYADVVAPCGHCGDPFWRDDMSAIGEGYYCDACRDEKFRFCSSCQQYVDSDRANYSEVHDCDYCESCFDERVTYCATCNNQIDIETCRQNEDGECFCNDCSEHRDNPRCGEYLEFTGQSFIRCKSKRKFGIEIEALVGEGEDHLPKGDLRCWKQVPDGSLGNDGREYVSPILQGDEGFDEIAKFTYTLREAGYFVKRQCGLHVHIDGRDLDSEHIKVLLRITRYFEPVIYAMLPRSRYEGTYSVPLEKFPKSRFRVGVRDEESLKRFWYGPKGATVNLKSKYHHSRYFGLNIHSWFYRRSLEFRYHSGTLNPVKITNFIRLCQAIVDKAKETKKFRMARPLDFACHFEAFVSFFSLRPALVSYIRERILKFHPERFKTPAQVTQPPV